MKTTCPKCERQHAPLYGSAVLCPCGHRYDFPVPPVDELYSTNIDRAQIASVGSIMDDMRRMQADHMANEVETARLALASGIRVLPSAAVDGPVLLVKPSVYERLAK